MAEILCFGSAGLASLFRLQEKAIAMRMETWMLTPLTLAFGKISTVACPKNVAALSSTQFAAAAASQPASELDEGARYR